MRYGWPYRLESTAGHCRVVVRRARWFRIRSRCRAAATASASAAAPGQLLEDGGAFERRVADDERGVSAARAARAAENSVVTNCRTMPAVHRERSGPRVPAIVEQFPRQHRARLIHEQDERPAIGRLLLQRPRHQQLEERRAQSEIGRRRPDRSIEQPLHHQLAASAAATLPRGRGRSALRISGRRSCRRCAIRRRCHHPGISSKVTRRSPSLPGTRVSSNTKSVRNSDARENCVQLANRLDGAVFEQLERSHASRCAPRCGCRRRCPRRRRWPLVGRPPEPGVGALHRPENRLDGVGERDAAGAGADEQRHDAEVEARARRSARRLPRGAGARCRPPARRTR